jgi:aspartyl-tRNA(Asn)/glutamyl-tRNA(Gln) amidotransferase subunit C
MLARLGLEAGEEEHYQQQLGAILDHIGRLAEVDTEAIPPTAQVVPLEMRLRDDQPRPGLSPAQAMANAPRARSGLFVVGAIQEPEP